MIGLDTNVVVRYATRDHVLQSQRAARAIDALTMQNPGFISTIALAESAWVLARSYGINNESVAHAIERMLGEERLVVEHEREVFTALSLARDGQGQFSDALIGLISAKAGCRYTLTFDRRAASLPGFRLI